jgi:hypothetical protein
MSKGALSELVSYDEDYNAWVLEQVALLKAGRFSDLDIKHLAEELKALTASQQQEIENRLTVLLQHLLKWEFQPARRSDSWRATTLEQRSRINRVIQRSPSLRHYPAAVMAEEYLIARLRAADETGMALATFPPSVPYTAVQVLDQESWPGGSDLEE